VGVTLRERNPEPKVASPGPAQIFAGGGDTFIADLGIVTPVVNDQILGALALQIPYESMGILMLPEHRDRNQQGHKLTVHRP
jgi:hypothetical protein